MTLKLRTTGILTGTNKHTLDDKPLRLDRKPQAKGTICSRSTGDDQSPKTGKLGHTLSRWGLPDELAKMASIALWLAVLAAASTTASPVLSAKAESNTLNVDVDLQDITSAVRSLFLPGSLNATTPTNSSRCKVYPDDPEWPSDEAWSQLSKLTGDRVINAPTPLAAVCYPGEDYNAAKCSEYTVAAWQKSYIHMIDPIEIMSPVAQGMTCTPPVLFDSHGCTRGGFPMYVVNATEPKHVQLAVNFARNTGVRLVIKNTGHDFLGKSGGKDALSIWTHNMKNIEYIEEYADEKLNWTGPAFKSGVGVQAFEIYKAAAEKGRVVVGGEASRFGFNSAQTGNETFWAAIRAYVDLWIDNADAGTYTYWTLIPSNGTFAFAFSPFFAPGKNVEEATALLQPWFNKLNDLGVKFDPNITHYDNYYDAWRNSFPLEAVQKPNVATASRLFPRANFETAEKRQEVYERIRASSEKNRVQVHFNMQAKDPYNTENAVNTHWRPLVSFSMQSVRWPINSTAEEILKIRKDFQAGDMQSWRDISPGAGSYLAEADRLEPDFGNAFFGDNYPRLLELKKKLDPQDVFFATTGVGSERWRVESVDGLPNENGKLCRV
ncbi:uncharacterized protein ALTATR162_LOCUS2317 [Alternaria atra]|uniref:FAD-binding PCMH-type domain-containing protein n=1 Tax=Alternaria atra TaxID=119953 RepID=A0A8J2HXT2_9PLEO|nr:uncharacterized protein ALTATR162_LOCUS2317 [Alternaria atra]CAG5149212.1 unnamed protein product [Alternaria atra]